MRVAAGRGDAAAARADVAREVRVVEPGPGDEREVVRRADLARGVEAVRVDRVGVERAAGSAALAFMSSAVRSWPPAAEASDVGGVVAGHHQQRREQLVAPGRRRPRRRRPCCPRRSRRRSWRARRGRRGSSGISVTRGERLERAGRGVAAVRRPWPRAPHRCRGRRPASWRPRPAGSAGAPAPTTMPAGGQVVAAADVARRRSCAAAAGRWRWRSARRRGRSRPGPPRGVRASAWWRGRLPPQHGTAGQRHRGRATLGTVVLARKTAALLVGAGLWPLLVWPNFVRVVATDERAFDERPDGVPGRARRPGRRVDGARRRAGRARRARLAPCAALAPARWPAGAAAAARRGGPATSTASVAAHRPRPRRRDADAARGRRSAARARRRSCVARRAARFDRAGR